MAQLPAGAEGVAAGVLLWSSACFAANVLMIWLLWTGNERRSYLFIAVCLALVSTSSSIAQQAYDIIYYEDMMYARLARAQADAGNALMFVTDAAPPGVDLAMWCIRWGCYIGECGAAFFWSFTLCQSVYGWRDDRQLGKPLRLISELGKPFSVLIAILTMAVLQIQPLQKSLFWFSFVLNFFYCLFCAGSLFWFLLMFIEFFQTRRLFRRMNSHQRCEWERQPNLDTKGRARSHSTATSMNTVGRSMTSGEHFGRLAQPKGGIYDRFLIARTFVPCLMLSLFEVQNIVSNGQHPEQLRELALTTAPDLSAASAQGYFANFIPGCLASILLLVAFGTTKSLRDRMYQLFVPERWHSAVRRHMYRKSAEYRYHPMDSDNGILSRRKRLSMEKQLRIQVTYEFEIRNESAEVAAPSEGTGSDSPMPGGVRSDTAAMFDGRKDSRWEDTEKILPKKPSVTKARGHF